MNFTIQTGARSLADYLAAAMTGVTMVTSTRRSFRVSAQPSMDSMLLSIISLLF